MKFKLDFAIVSAGLRQLTKYKVSRVVVKFGKRVAADAGRRMVVASPHTPSPFESEPRYNLLVRLRMEFCTEAVSR